MHCQPLKAPVHLGHGLMCCASVIHKRELDFHLRNNPAQPRLTNSIYMLMLQVSIQIVVSDDIVYFWTNSG